MTPGAASRRFYLIKLRRDRYGDVSYFGSLGASVSTDFQGTGAERRIALRANVAIEASLRRAGRTAFQVQIRDLSRTGCRGETLSRLNQGEQVWITLPGFAPLAGDVRWASVQQFGVHWTAAMHASVFDHIRAQFPDFFR